MRGRGPEGFNPVDIAPATAVNFDAIHLRADFRRRDQALKVEMINIKQPWATEGMRNKEEGVRALVAKEASGENLETTLSEDQLLTQAAIAQSKAEETEKIFPRLAAYNLARCAKLRFMAGIDIDLELAAAATIIDKSKASASITAANLLPESILLGIQRKMINKMPLPTKESVAQAAIDSPKLLADYALVLPEAERPEFLALIPDNKRREVSILLDASSSTVLDQSIVDKDSVEDKQRKEVRLRAFAEFKKVLEDSKSSEDNIAVALARTMGRLGGDARLLLLELAREEVDTEAFKKDKEKEYLPFILGILMKKFDDWRVNDLALQLVAEPSLPEVVRRSLLQKLVKRGYLGADVGVWWDERSKQSKKDDNTLETRTRSLELLQKVIGDLGVAPSKEILEFLNSSERWGEISLDERVEKIRTSQEEFSGAKTQTELVEILVADENKAMMFYLLHGGEDRFNLINNYNFDKFKEMLKLISDLKVHEQPIADFKHALIAGGMEAGQAARVIENLRGGHYPLERAGQAYQEVSFEVSENAAVKNANTEIGKVLGREQLGVVLLFPVYRKFLSTQTGEVAEHLLEKVPQAQTFSQRLELIAEIEKAYPLIHAEAQKSLQESWRVLDEKMILGMTLDQVLADNSVSVRGEEILPRLNSKRLDLKRIKKDLLVALRGGNKKLDKLRGDLHEKRKARTGLSKGLERQTDPARKAELEGKIKNLDQTIDDLEKQQAILMDGKVSDRFEGMSKAQKDEEVERVGREIIALTEKSSSAIFTYLTMQVLESLGDDILTEQDVTLIKEMESHLQGPFQTIEDNLTYHKPSVGDVKKNARVGMRLLDKSAKLMNMVRFADSKICCFSSSNYEMQVAHNTPNKHWVASINADPMSFVIALEVPQGDVAADNKVPVTENLGFIFGSFGTNKDGGLAIMMNGIYYAPGVEDSRQVEAMLGGVERIFEGLPIETIAIASQHGGSIKLPEGYANNPVELKRLRAIDDGRGRPETKVYDDIGTDSSMNEPKVYNSSGSGSLWHRTKKRE